jgi:hypothetical protein
MNPTAIYSKSGKGVQEASGKTSYLKRPDRAVLSAIDGRATVGEVAQKVSRSFDAGFQQLIQQLDKDGFIREVTSGTSVAGIRTVSPPAAKPAAPSDASSDLDFSSLGATTRPAPQPPPQRVAMPPPPPPKKAAADAPPALSAQEKAKAEQAAKEQQATFAKAREEAERKAQEDRERVKTEAEAKVRAETEAKLRAEAEKKLTYASEEKEKSAREAAARAVAEAKAAAEAKAKAQAEAKRAREEAERVRKDAERKAKEAAERARKEAERARKEAEELKQRLEEERRAREEAERRAEEEEARRKEAEEKPLPVLQPAKSEGFSDSLLADLDSFTKREEESRKAEEQTERRKKDEKARRRQEEEEHKAREAAEAASERERRDDEERRRSEDEDRRAREEEERAQREAEEHAQREAARVKELAKSAKAPVEEDIPVTEDDLGMDDVRRDERAMSREARQRAEAREEARKFTAAPVVPSRPRRRMKLGKPIAITLLVAIVGGLIAAHFIPLATEDYEQAASEALGRPVKISAAHLSLVQGLELKFDGVSIGDTKIAAVRAHPELASLNDERKSFSRIDLDGVTLPQAALGELLGARVKGANFSVARINATQVKLAGPLELPLIEAKILLAGDGSLASASLSGPESLMAKLIAKGAQLEFDMTASSFQLPIAPQVRLTQFGMKGIATRQGMKIESWGGSIFDGAISGTANIRWGGTWIVDGAMTVRGVNAAVFAPALLSEGKAEGSGRFALSGADPAKLAATGRVEGNFTIRKGVLGSVDLSRAIQTGGRQAGGRTQFTELTGQGVFDRGSVALRNISIGAGALNAGASADIAQSGALSGRIIADVRATGQSLRTTLNLGGTVREPQVRN